MTLLLPLFKKKSFKRNIIETDTLYTSVHGNFNEKPRRIVLELLV